MKKTFKLLTTFLIIIILQSCYSIKNINDSFTEVTLIQHNKMQFVELEFNGIKTKLLIDTGASKSLLDISKAEKFDFKYVLLSEEQYIGIGGLADIYVIYDYEIRGIFISFLGADLNAVTRYFYENNIEIVGILGSDFLEKHDAIIDYKKNIMYLNR